MNTAMKEFEHLKIHLEELKKVTDSFRSKVIGQGGFGKVYEGEVSHSQGRSKVAIKRLNREFGQGDLEFWKEIMVLSRYTHKNLISLLGFCDEDGEKILVYEHASNGSLDRHLSSSALTWTQRLKICLDVAKGLAYLHDHKGTQQRVLHRDVKSANILLYDNWNAKLCDMGLSKLAPANQLHTVLFTNVVGTPGYCDPQYMSTYTLTKESDIYSFGVVLFEVLCGRLCFTRTNSHLQILVPMWKESYERKKLDRIIFKDLIPYMDLDSLETFSSIAFQCLHNSREQRPKTSLLVKKLESALRFQERHDKKLTNNDVENFQKSRYADELSALLSKGKMIFFNRDKKNTEGGQEKDAKGSIAAIAEKGAAPPHADAASIAAIAEKGAAPPHADSARDAVREVAHFDDTMGFEFTVEDLLHASGEVMGKSTYGTHYAATLENGDKVAVYRLREPFTKTQRQIEVELYLLKKIRHPNLLAVRSYYLDPRTRRDIFLVHDYMPKGSLADILVHDYMRKESLADIFHNLIPEKWLDWPTRMKIAKGMARGLHCLHTHHNTIHGNLTSHNVWLDGNFNPKISDFGLSLKNINPETRFLCYWDPDLKYDNKANKKTDIYSLGMIMLELLTGKKVDMDLSQWVANLVERMDKVDWDFGHRKVRNGSTFVDGELLNSLQLALDCVHASPWVRPDIRRVLQRLEEIRPETTTNSSGNGNDSSNGNGGVGSSLSW